jgi:adsorption protein B
MFITHLVTGKRLAWDKTMHDFPSADGFVDRRQRLGELLVSWQAIDQDKLELALKEGHAREAPIGRVLMAKGWLDEETLAEAIAFQADLQRGRFDADRLLSEASRLPLETIVRHRALPQGDNAAGHALVLVASPLAEAPLAELEAQLQRPVVQQIVREGDIAAGLRLLRGVDLAQQAAEEDSATPVMAAPVSVRSVPLIGDLLIERGYVRREDFETALQDYRPDQHGRIGDYMVARSVISRDALDNVIQEQRRLSGAAAATE